MKFLDEWDRRLARLSEERFYFVLLAVMATLVTALVMGLALILHRNFLTIACDTAAIQNAIVNTLHGNWFRDTAYDGPNLLGLHTMLVLVLIAPIYAMFPYPETLFILQVVGIYSAVIPLYLVAVEILRRPLVAFLIAATMLASPLLLHMAMAPFHPESWILAAVLWSYYFYRRNQSLRFWISFAIAVTSGEQAALIYAALGLSLLLADDGIAWRKRYGWWALGAGLSCFLFSVEILIPLMRTPEQHNLLGYHYAGWNADSVSQLASALIQDPFRTVSMLLAPMRWAHVISLVGLPLLLVFLSRRGLALLLPFPIYFLMSDQEFYLYFHAYYYQFALFAGYMALVFFLARWEVSTRLGLMVLIGTFFMNALLVCPVMGFYTGLAMGRDDALSSGLHEAFDKIPPDAAVYSPHRYSAYLSNRTNLVMGDLYDKNFDFKAMLDANFATTNVHPEQIDYIVSDLQNDQCGWRQGGYNPDATKLRADTINHLLKSGQWQIFWNQSNIVILKRIGSDASL